MDMVPRRMDKDMIQDAIKKNSRKVQEYTQEMDCICPTAVREIILETKNILKIDALNDYVFVVRVDLNNNLIEKIQGLECLVNLSWLDLSFNHIRKIEGLDTLRKLKVLNLSMNKISLLEKMDSLDELTHFFIADNLLGDRENLLYLRRFKKLFHVYTNGNPVSKEPDYQLFMTAFLPTLKCLDNILLDNALREEAYNTFQEEVERKNEEELQKQLEEEEEKIKEAELKLHKEAFVDLFNGPHLFYKMFEDDPFATTIHSVPGVRYLLQIYEESMVTLCKQLFDSGMSEHEQRQKELSSFRESQEDLEAHSRHQATRIQTTFNRQHKDRLKELEGLSVHSLIQVKLIQCNSEIDQFCEKLMTVEFKMISKLEEYIKKFDTCISDMVDRFSETVHSIFSQCEQLEEDFNGKLHELCHATLDKVAEEDHLEELPHDVKALFTERNIVIGALTTGHNNHLTFLEDQMKKLLAFVRAWKMSLFKEIDEKGTQQNHTRISDIHRYADFLRKQLTPYQ